MPRLECESSHPAIDKGFEFADAKTYNKDSFSDEIDRAEREATDKCYEHAMRIVGYYRCKDNCQKRFTISFGPTTVIKAQPQRVDGLTLYQALVFVDWVLDIDCKKPKPGGGVRHGRPE